MELHNSHCAVAGDNIDDCVREYSCYEKLEGLENVCPKGWRLPRKSDLRYVHSIYLSPDYDKMTPKQQRKDFERAFLVFRKEFNEKLNFSPEPIKEGFESYEQVYGRGVEFVSNDYWILDDEKNDPGHFDVEFPNPPPLSFGFFGFYSFYDVCRHHRSRVRCVKE